MVAREELAGLVDIAKTVRLRSAATHGDLDCLCKLLKAGEKVNKPDLNLALSLASINGHDACIHLLLEAGAELKQASSRGQTALMCAVSNGHDACTLTLLKAGADPLALSDNGKTAEQEATAWAQSKYCPAAERERILRCIQLLQQQPR